MNIALSLLVCHALYPRESRGSMTMTANYTRYSAINTESLGPGPGSRGRRSQSLGSAVFQAPDQMSLPCHAVARIVHGRWDGLGFLEW